MIPARLASSRFPGKPLTSILGLPMIEHVRRRAQLCATVDAVYVATCDEEIRQVVESFGGAVIMTAASHERCTDRIEEAARTIDCDVVVNVQGDEPALLPEVVDAVVAPLLADSAVCATCVVYRMTDLADALDPNVVKTVLSRSGSILYLSRAAIPSNQRGHAEGFKQSGVYAFRKDFLHRYSKLPPTPLEASESVDMLRILEHDYRITSVLSETETVGVDVPEHVAAVERLLRSDPTQQMLHERITRR